MRIDRVRDLALYVRDRRRQLNMTQAELADSAKVSRRWLSSLEAGKPTAEIGLVLRTLRVLGLVLDARPEGDRPKGGDAIDLDAHLRALRGDSGDDGRPADDETSAREVVRDRQHPPSDDGDA